MTEPIFLAFSASLLFLGLGVVLASDAYRGTRSFGAVPVALFGVLLLFVAGLKVHQSAQKQTTIKCKTAQCPYVLKVHEDSSRTWQERE
jgi:predicted Na+-dependent transporter